VGSTATDTTHRTQRAGPVLGGTTVWGSTSGCLIEPGALESEWLALSGWRPKVEALEASPVFDVSGWPVADKTSALSLTPPKTLSVFSPTTTATTMAVSGSEVSARSPRR